MIVLPSLFFFPHISREGQEYGKFPCSMLPGKILIVWKGPAAEEVLYTAPCLIRTFRKKSRIMNKSNIFKGYPELQDLPVFISSSLFYNKGRHSMAFYLLPSLERSAL